MDVAECRGERRSRRRARAGDRRPLRRRFSAKHGGRAFRALLFRAVLATLASAGMSGSLEHRTAQRRPPAFPSFSTNPARPPEAFSPSPRFRSLLQAGVRSGDERAAAARSRSPFAPNGPGFRHLRVGVDAALEPPLWGDNQRDATGGEAHGRKSKFSPPSSTRSAEMVDIAEEIETMNTPSKTTYSSKVRRINTDFLLYRARLERRGYRAKPDGAEREQSSLNAEKAFRRCLILNPEDGRGYVGLGTLFTKQKRYKEAEELFEEATRLTSGTNPYIWTAWANAMSKQGKTERARKLFEGAVVADSRHAAAWHGWGLMEKRLGNLRRAVDLFTRGIKNTESRANPYLYQSLGLVLEQMGNIEAARSWYMKGTKKDTVTKSDALWHSWAKMESKHGNPDVVRYLYKRALDANKKSRYTYLSWGVWEKEQGNAENARILFEQGNKLNPRDAAILQAWALLEYESGNIRRARDLLKHATKVDSKHIPVWQAWGVLEYVEGNYNRARELFQQGVWAGPNSRDVSRVFQAWAVLEKKQKNFNLARTLFSCAVKADRLSEASWLAWAQMEEDLGLDARAEELRNFNQLEQQKLALADTGGSFSSLIVSPDSILSPIFRGVQSWIKQFSESQSKPFSYDDEDVFNYQSEVDKELFTEFKIPDMRNVTGKRGPGPA